MFRVRLIVAGIAGAGLVTAAPASVASARTPAKDEVEPSPRITVRVYNYAGALRGTLLQAEEESSRIFHEAGVEVAWFDCPTTHAEEEKYPACALPLGAMAVDLKVLPAFMAERLRPGREEMGRALTSARAGIASTAWVFYERVEQAAASQVASQSQILGHAMTHEIGHLLLGSEQHSHGGIMRANWDRKCLEEASRGQLFFTRNEAELIRTEVLTRSEVVEASAPRQPPSRGLLAVAGR